VAAPILICIIIIGKATIAVWRSRALEKSFPASLRSSASLSGWRKCPRRRFNSQKKFYKAVQLDCAEWIKLGTTKTAMVYGLDDGQRLNNRE